MWDWSPGIQQERRRDDADIIIGTLKFPMLLKRIWQLGNLSSSDFFAGLSEVPQLSHVQVVRDERAATLSVELDSLVLRTRAYLVGLRVQSNTTSYPQLKHLIYCLVYLLFTTTGHKDNHSHLLNCWWHLFLHTQLMLPTHACSVCTPGCLHSVGTNMLTLCFIVLILPKCLVRSVEYWHWC